MTAGTTTFLNAVPKLLTRDLARTADYGVRDFSLIDPDGNLLTFGERSGG